MIPYDKMYENESTENIQLTHGSYHKMSYTKFWCKLRVIFLHTSYTSEININFYALYNK